MDSPTSEPQEHGLTSGQTAVIVLSLFLVILCTFYVIWSVRINLHGYGFKPRK